MIDSVQMKTTDRPRGTSFLALWHGVFRALAFSMILVLLTVRLGSLSEELFVTPVEDALFDTAFVNAADKGPLDKPLAAKYKCALECDLPQYQVSVISPLHLPVTPSASVQIFSPQGNAFKIYIPPESSS